MSQQSLLIENWNLDLSLHEVVRRNEISKIENLLSLGYNVNERNSCGRTPLHVAVCKNKGNSHQEAISLLLNSGADVNIGDSYGDTVLHYVAKEKTGFSKTILDLLIEFNASIDACNNQGETPLDCAFNCARCVEIAQLLMERGANVNRRSKKGYTALHSACVWREKKKIKCLMENGADINARDPNGQIPLRLYSVGRTFHEREYEEIYRVLLDFSDLTNNTVHSYFEFNLMLPMFIKEMILEQIAKLQVLNVSVHSSFLEDISNSKHAEYLNKCTKELLVAKSSKLKNSWVTFFNLLVDDERKLKNYAGNQDLVEDFNQTDCLKKFPIYGAAIQKNMEKGIVTRKLFDETAEKLSDCCPVFNPTHLIIRDVLDCLNSKDYKIFV